MKKLWRLWAKALGEKAGNTDNEGLSDMLYKYVNGVYIPEMWGPGEAERLWCYRVEVRETQSNMAFREGHREWNEDLLA